MDTKFILPFPELNRRSLLQIQYLSKIQTTSRKRLQRTQSFKILQVKRSTYFSWLKKYNNKCGTQRMKTTGLANKSRRFHNFRTTKVISAQLVSHILKIR